MRRPAATYTIIAINVAVFLYEQTLSIRDSDQFLLNWSLIPARFTHPAQQILGIGVAGPASPRILTIVTSLFLHGGLTHIGLNMFLLFAIGRMLEMAIGTPRFVLLYTLAGVASSLAVIVLYRNSDSPFIGASGAVYGVMGGYFLLLPPGPDRTKTIIWMLALILLPALIPAQLILRLTGSDFLANIAHWGHVGGFLTGILTMYLMMRQVRRRRAGQYATYEEDVPTEPVQPPA
ncbi:MAG: rhomboid family intramembrane serine protease [Chloroflexota bacterium]|nr:rhomboid family intramembrane serine protease [Chloroflexota bacterium]